MPRSRKPRRSPPGVEPRADRPSRSEGPEGSTTRAVGETWGSRTANIVARWAPGSGQLELDLAPSRSAEPAAEHAGVVRLVPAERTADDWYDAAVDLESTAPEAAADAYRSALELEPGHADAHLNLGRLLHEARELRQAEAHYRAAAAADTGNAVARFNLGVVLEDSGKPREAIREYQDALKLDDRLAAAHFNLSRLLEAKGERAKALSHLAAYRRLAD